VAESADQSKPTRSTPCPPAGIYSRDVEHRSGEGSARPGPPILRLLGDGGSTLDGALVLDTLLSAPVLAFGVAVLAGLARFELRLPEALPPILSMFLLFAIGLKGGRSIGGAALADLLGPLVVVVLIGVVAPVVAFLVMRSFVRLGRADSAGVAAHYGAFSTVTFIVAVAVVEERGLGFEGVLAGLLAFDFIGIVIALLLVRGRGTAGTSREGIGVTLSRILRGRSIAYILSGLVIGALASENRLAPVDPLFVGLFQGALVLFLLEMGAIAAERLRTVAAVGPRLIAAAIVVPVVNGTIGALIGAAVGLSTGGVLIVATLASSASYIAAPAAVRISLPEADPALSITASLGITFPFNLTLGIPLYLWMATQLT
jgi:hypothetical protein